MTNGISINNVAAFYDAQLDHMRGYDEAPNGRLARIKKSLGRLVRPGMTVLDIGCGTGVTSRHMAGIGAKVTAVDVSPRLIDYAKSKSNGIDYIVGDIKDIGLKAQFDVIVMADVFEHIIRDYVFTVVRSLLYDNAYEDTIVYLSLPNCSFLRFMKRNFPEKLQIVDEPWNLNDVLGLFEYFEFVPIAMQMYGLDVEAQYVEIVFVHENKLDRKYTDRMRQIYTKEAS